MELLPELLCDRTQTIIIHVLVYLLIVNLLQQFLLYVCISQVDIIIVIINY